jgi:hypothetical protein
MSSSQNISKSSKRNLRKQKLIYSKQAEMNNRIEQQTSDIDIFYDSEKVS